MNMQLLAGAAVLVLAGGMTTSAVASSHKTGRSSSHVTRTHAAGTQGSARHGRLRAAERDDAYGYGGARSLGPLGFTFGCVNGYCGQGYSVSAWSY